MTWWKGYGTKDTWLSLALSVVIHLCAVAILAGIYGESRKEVQVVIADLTLVAGYGADPGKASPSPGRVRGNGLPRAARERVKGESVPKNKEVEESHPLPRGESLRAARDMAPQAVSLVTEPVAYTMSAGEASDRRRGVTGPGWATGSGGGAGGGTGLRGTRTGTGAGGTGTGTGGGGLHTGSDYYYIRETVMKNIRYPERARRMGQEGQVVLSFVVLENGSTSNVRVVSSCGFRLLDESAKEGVINTTIDRKVPYRVVVTLPITYRLQ